MMDSPVSFFASSSTADTSMQNNEVLASPKLLKSTHFTCEVCNQTLPQHLFPKKKYRVNHKKNQKNNDDTINNNHISNHIMVVCCRQCKKNQTAQRCKQPTKVQTKQGRTSEGSGVKRRPNNFGYCNYLDQLFSMDCFPDIINLKAFTSAKDVSESMAALQGASQHGSILSKKKDGNNKKKKIKCLCIGDGSTPRTAVLGCFLKKWSCTSIDPALHKEWHGVEPKGVHNLIGFSGTLEEYLLQMKRSDDIDNNEMYDHLILLCVHSHARLIGDASVPNIMARYNNIPTTLISLPCCPKFRSQKDVGRPPDVCYEDDCVFSACRRVEVWNFDYTMCAECST